MSSGAKIEYCYILLILYKPLLVIKDWKPITDLINALTWPVVAVFFLLAFRKPLTALIAGLSGRVTKLSAFQISIELAALPEPPSLWSDPTIPQVSEMTGGNVSSTTLMQLFQSIEAKPPSDYLIVDVKEGQFWFISRVFIFTLFLQAMRGLKCVVFVESKGDHDCRLIGLASPDAVHRALIEKYPWLGHALLKAMIAQKTFVLTPPLNSSQAILIIQGFIADPEMRVAVLPTSSSDKWTRLGTQNIWERTEWLTVDKINECLRKGKALYEWDSSHYEDTLNIQTDERTRELICRKAPFIALVNSKGEFQRLLDRQKLLEQVAQFLQNEQ